MWRVFCRNCSQNASNCWQKKSQMNRRFEDWWAISKQKGRLQTVAHLDVIVPPDLSKTFLQLMKVSRVTQEYQYAVNLNNRGFQKAPCSEFLNVICICIRTKCNWHKNFKQQIIYSAENLSIGFWKISKRRLLYRRRSSSVTRLTSTITDLWRNKIVGLGPQRTRKRCTKGHCIDKKLLFWCGVWAGGVIGRYVFENEAGQ